MHARLISFSGADPARRDEAEQTMRGTVLPMLRGYDGFAGYIALFDGANRRAKASGHGPSPGDPTTTLCPWSGGRSSVWSTSWWHPSAWW